MNIRIMLMLSFLLNTTSAFAAEPIEGFSDYKFGMSFVEIDNKLTLSEEESFNDLERVFGAEEPITVLGESFSLNFSFQDDQLSVINLFRQYEASDVACISDFDRNFAAIQARYGSPDSDPEKGDPMRMKVSFTAPNGSAVVLSGMSSGLLEKCIMVIAYIGPKAGSTF